MTILLIALGAYLLLLAAMYALQRSILYPAGTGLPAIEAAGMPGLREITTTTDDGLRLRHWFVPPRRAGAATVVVFHGNAGTLADRVPKFRFLADAGYGVLFAGYRGYGANAGSPTQAHLVEDARRTLDWLEGEGIAPAKTVLYGESLGSGVAVLIAAGRKVGALVLEAPFTSVAEVAQAHYWYLPARWLILDKWKSLDLAPELTAPVLILHGEKDAVTEARFGRRLLEAIRSPKESIFVPEAGHNDLYDFGLREPVTGFIARQVGDAQAPEQAPARKLPAQ